MRSGIRYSDEFKQEAVKQVSIHGYSVAEVANNLGVTSKSLYSWLKQYTKPKIKREQESDLLAENARLKRQLKRAQQERDILKEAAVFFANESKNDTRS